MIPFSPHKILELLELLELLEVVSRRYTEKIGFLGIVCVVNIVDLGSTSLTDYLIKSATEFSIKSCISHQFYDIKSYGNPTNLS